MIRSLSDWRLRSSVILFMTLAIMPRVAAAQGLGAGPLTSSLATTEPETGVLRLGRLRVAPGVVVREIGWDSNVFDEAENPKEDYVAAVAPDISAFMRLRFVQVSAYGGGDFNYYKTYESERSAGYAGRGRVDFLLSRVRPFVGGGRANVRTRPNGEIDVRASRVEDELSGGLAYDLSDHSAIYGSAFQQRIRYVNALEDGIDLSAALDHNRNDYSMGVRTDITPLLSMTVSGGYQEDQFSHDALRNADSRNASLNVRIGAEAIVSGSATVTFKDYRPTNPLLRSFRGVTAGGLMSYSFLEIGRLTFSGTRNIEYSFDAAEAFYMENSAMLYYTHRLFGKVDAQVRGGRSIFDYSFSEVTPAHKDTLDTGGASVGYNLNNRTRISLNYELARRRSPVLPERNYDRKRVYVAWAYAL